jgi:hypothetical protein
MRGIWWRLRKLGPEIVLQFSKAALVQIPEIIHGTVPPEKRTHPLYMI